LVGVRDAENAYGTTFTKNRIIGADWGKTLKHARGRVYSWRKGIASWTIGNTLYLSVVFTWDLLEARKIAEASKKRVIAGGPAVKLMPDYLEGVAETNDTFLLSGIEPLALHNPLATFITRGCVNACPFCAVPKLEGKFVELEWFRPAPVLCDNNLLAASKMHFVRVIQMLKTFPYADFNQGLEAARFTSWHAEQIASLKGAKVRFSLDSFDEETAVADAIFKAKTTGLRDLGVYVLIGFNDTPSEAKEKLEWVRSRGIRPTPMRYQPLDCFVKNSYISSAWTEKELKDVTRYYSRLRYLEHVPFEDYQYGSFHREEELFKEVSRDHWS
jgi:hypothetical protein